MGVLFTWNFGFLLIKKTVLLRIKRKNNHVSPSLTNQPTKERTNTGIKADKTAPSN